jgi:hypothetical protein
MLSFYQLHQLLQYHVVSDSVPVACQLLSLENTYPPAYQLALDMFKRLHTHEQIVEVLLTKKQVISKKSGLLIQGIIGFKVHEKLQRSNCESC